MDPGKLLLTTISLTVTVIILASSLSVVIQTVSAANHLIKKSWSVINYIQSIDTNTTDPEQLLNNTDEALCKMLRSYQDAFGDIPFLYNITDNMTYPDICENITENTSEP